jgi:hypothetical protein
VIAGSPLLTPGTGLSPGTGVAAAAAALPSSGPLARVLVAGLSQKAAGAGAVATDTLIPAGTVLYSVRLGLNAAAGGGSALVLSDPRYRAALRDKQGNDVASQAAFAVGSLEVTLAE